MPIGYSVFSTLLMALICFTPSTGSPVRHRRSTGGLPWASPCGSAGTATTSDDFEPIEPSLSELSTELHLRSVEAHSLAMTLKDLLFVYRLSSSNSLAQVCEDLHLHNFPLPADVMFWTHHNFTGEVAKKDYINLSKALVYLEALKFDDAENNNSTLYSNIESLEKKILSILCTLDSIIASLGLSVDSHVSRDIMPNSLREITSTADRHKRDYIIGKDCVHLMTSTKDSHMAMKLGLQ